MSGWAPTDKQPWRYGEPYTSYNRASLNLKMQLTPYLYSYTRIANLTGVPPVRALVIEYPDDPVTWGTTTQYQFLSGEWFLVAPVYEDATSRSGIYLPAGEWFDYNTGSIRTGPTTLNNYPAPLSLIPVFVKAGAIIPMWPVMQYVFANITSPLTLDVYPGSQSALSSFTLYEDDGISRLFNTQNAEQTFSLDVSANGIILGSTASIGSFVGKLVNRAYYVIFHISVSPGSVTLNGQAVPQVKSQSAFNAATIAWFFDAVTKGGQCLVKTGSLTTAAEFKTVLTP